MTPRGTASQAGATIQPIALPAALHHTASSPNRSRRFHADTHPTIPRDYFDGTAPEAFVVARIACQAAPDSGVYFTAVPGDYAAVTESPGKISMFYVWDCLNDAEGQYVLIREEEDEA